MLAPTTHAHFFQRATKVALFQKEPTLDSSAFSLLTGLIWYPGTEKDLLFYSEHL